MSFNTEITQLKKGYTNSQLKDFYDKKNNILNALYPHRELTPSGFFNSLFSEAINADMMCGNYNGEHDGKSNGKLFIYSPNASRKTSIKKQIRECDFLKVKKKFMITYDNMDDLDSLEGLNDVLVSPNMHFGINEGMKSLSLLCNIDIDFDGVYENSDLERLIMAFENNKILMPTLLVNTGTGVHLIYRLKTPVFVYGKEELKKEFKKLKSAIITKMNKNYKFNKNAKQTLDRLSIDQMIRCPGSTTKLGEFASSKEEAKQDIVRVWEIGDSYEIFDLCLYAEYTWNDSILPSKVKEFSNYFLCNEKYYKFIKKNVYYSWTERFTTVSVGHRYFAMLGLASAARKCNISRAELKSDLTKLMFIFNARDVEKVTSKDLECALKAFDYDENIIRYKGVYILDNCGLKPLEKKRKFGDKEAYSEAVKKGLAKRGRYSKEMILLEDLIRLYCEGYNIFEMSIRGIAAHCRVQKTAVGKYLKSLLEEIKKCISINFNDEKLPHFDEVLSACEKNLSKKQNLKNVKEEKQVSENVLEKNQISENLQENENKISNEEKIEKYCENKKKIEKNEGNSSCPFLNSLFNRYP